MVDEILQQQAQLQKIVQHDEKRLKQAVHQLAFAVEKKIDIRQYISKYPYPFIVGGFFAGIAFAFLQKNKEN